jgi:hypothetical protein
VLYFKDEGEVEKSKKFDLNTFKDTLVIGGQGLHFHIQNSFETIKNIKSIKIITSWVAPSGENGRKKKKKKKNRRNRIRNYCS